MMLTISRNDAMPFPPFSLMLALSATCIDVASAIPAWSDIFSSLKPSTETDEETLLIESMDEDQARQFITVGYGHF